MISKQFQIAARTHNYRLISSSLYQVSYSKSGIINSPHHIIYNVISQTQHYPKFIPFVSSSQIVKNVSPLQNYTKLTINYNNFKGMSYTSKVKLSPILIAGAGAPIAAAAPNKSTIHSFCSQAPLKKLQSLWQIQPKDEKKSFVSYKLDYEFNSPFYMLVSSMVKDFMGEQLWKLFESQALKQTVIMERQKKTKKYQNISAHHESSSTISKELLTWIQCHPNKQVKAKYFSNPQFCRKINQLHRRVSDESKSNHQNYLKKMNQQAGKII